MEQNYDKEAVKELLSWAQDVLDNKRYPSGRFQVNKSVAVLDCGKYLDSMMSMISYNWENPTFHPTIDQLRSFQSKLETAVSSEGECGQ